MNPPSQPLEKPFLEKVAILLGVTAPFAATFYAILLLWERYITAIDLAMLITFFYLSGIGVTVGLHRLLTHRSFETYPIVKAVLFI
jgi:stearoyl-CoA desaturase (delta-9 desaturase)